MAAGGFWKHQVAFLEEMGQILSLLKITLSHLFVKFVAIPFRSSGSEEHFDKKVLLKLSFILKSRKFERCEDNSNGTTSLVCTAHIGFIHILWCGLLFYPQQRQCESQRMG